MISSTASRWLPNFGRLLSLDAFWQNGNRIPLVATLTSNKSVQCLQSSSMSTSSSGSNHNNKGVADPDGFSVENLDPDSKEKLQSLKNVLVKNSYYEKYKAKIMKAQRSYPMEFLAMLEGLKSSKTKSHVSDYVPKMSQTKKRDLNEVIKVDLLNELEKDDITFIWQEYHRKKNLLAACMPGTVFDKLLVRTDVCSTFVLPLARKNGHDFHVVQFSNCAFYVTPLVSWQAYKENSPATLTVIYFDELKPSKGLALMRGEFDKNSLTLQEAQNLAVQIHLYFAEPNFNRNVLLEKFVSEPSYFKHDDLIIALEEMEAEHPELFGLDENSSGRAN